MGTNVGYKKLRMWFSGAQRTELSPELMEQMSKIDELTNYARMVSDRIRLVAQPNKLHRTAERLVPQDDSKNDRVQLMKELQNGTTGCFSDNPAVVDFFKKAAESTSEVNKAEDLFLRQTQIYAVNELKKFSEVTYMEIRQAFDELNKKRTAYDFARDRLRRCPPGEVEKRGQEAIAYQKEFEQQASVLHGLLMRIPDYQMDIAKAVNYFIKAEAEFGRTLHTTLKTIRDPSLSRKPVEQIEVAANGMQPTTKSPGQSPGLSTKPESPPGKKPNPKSK